MTTKRVFVHTKETATSEYENEGRSFSRVPVVGEYLALRSDSPWYKVFLVVHCPFQDAEYQAEVFAVRVDQVEEIIKQDGYQWSPTHRKGGA